MRRYYTYILTNKSRGVLYTGVTSNISRRVEEHESGFGSKFSAKYHTHRLVYIEVFESPELAIQREKYIKNRGREWKIRLIEDSNPGWEDLMQGLI